MVVFGVKQQATIIVTSGFGKVDAIAVDHSGMDAGCNPVSIQS